MRKLWIAMLMVALMPMAALADHRFSHSIGCGQGFGNRGGVSAGWGHSGGWTSRPTVGGWQGHRPGFHGRYAVPQVYSQNRIQSDFKFRSGLYRGDFDFRSSLYRGDVHRQSNFHKQPRGGYHYYGPALERFHRDARESPSYHFERREAFIRGR